MTYQIKKSYSDTISVTISYSETVDDANYISKFNIVESSGISSKIFLFQKNIDLTDTFICVCQPYMLSDDTVYPPRRPGEGKGFGFYRAKSVEITYTAAGDCLINRTDMLNKIQTLVNNYGIILEGFQTTPKEQTIEEEED